MKTNWRPLQDYEDKYLISDYGDVYSIGSEKYMEGYFNMHGYRCVSISGNGRHKNKAVHRMVAQTFIENPENKPCVNHIDGNKKNNRTENLEWVTYTENINHAYETGLKTSPNGANHWTARKTAYKKLSDEKVLEIKRKLDEGMTQMLIADEFGISQSVVSKIKNKKTSIFKRMKKSHKQAIS